MESKTRAILSNVENSCVSQLFFLNCCNKTPEVGDCMKKRGLSSSKLWRLSKGINSFSSNSGDTFLG